MHDPRKASIYDPLTPLIRGTEAGKTNYTDSRLKIVLTRNSVALAVLFQYSRYYIVAAFISNKSTPDLKFNIYQQKVSQGVLVNVHIVMAVVNFFYRLETLKDLKPVCIFLLKKKTLSHFIILTCMIGTTLSRKPGRRSNKALLYRYTDEFSAGFNNTVEPRYND